MSILTDLFTSIWLNFNNAVLIFQLFISVPSQINFCFNKIYPFNLNYIHVNGFLITKIAPTSLVVQALRIRLPMQGTWVQALVQEDPTCCGATKPMCHNC